MLANSENENTTAPLQAQDELNDVQDKDGVNPAEEKPIESVPEQPPRNDALLSKIAQKKELVKRLNDELYYLRHCNAELVDKERGLQERMQLRQRDQQQLLVNYNEHVRSRRATEDDTLTIRAKLLALKTMIKEMSVKLTTQCDETKTASLAVRSFWINLNEAISQLGSPIPKRRLCMLTEKFLMDVLVQSMNYNTFPGLKIAQPYTQLQTWFDQYDPEFCTRLRQEVAKTVVKGIQTADIQAETTKFSKRMYHSLYTSLLKAYPFMEKYDAQEPDVNKRYSTLIQSMVEQATSIGYAIRGQEVEIAAAAVGEGTEPLDLKTMNDEDGQTSGIIQFCICPPFVVYGSRIEILEKARVLCSSYK